MKLNEKENKALWYFSEVLTYEEDKEQWKVIENLIEKQQKIIDSLKYDKRFLYGVIDELKGVNNE